MNPFDSAAYAALTKGLDVVEAMLSAVLSNKDIRIDSQFYTMVRPRNPNLHYAKLGTMLKSTEYGISQEMNETGNGFPIYRMNEIHSMLCDLDVLKYVDIKEEDARRYFLQDGDLLFNRTNSYEMVGRCGVYYGNDSECKVFASYLVRLNPDTNILLPEYVAAYFNTEVGIAEVRRRARQSINQTNVNPEEVKEIEIPVFDVGFQNTVRQKFRKAHQLLIDSRNLYREAGVELECALGIDAWRPTGDNISVKTFSDTMKAGRIDAEYFQPRHDEILARLKSLGKYEYASEIIVAGLEKVVPESMERYIELADVGAQGTIENCTVAEWRDLPSRARQRIRAGHIIVSSIEGSLESCALVEREFDNALCSTGFHRFHSEQTNSETLLLIFKSWPLQSLLKRGCSGTILTGISSSELERIPVPILPRKVQDSLAEKVRKAFALRKESKKLIAEAKQMVEDAIEGKVF